MSIDYVGIFIAIPNLLFIIFFIIIRFVSRKYNIINFNLINKEIEEKINYLNYAGLTFFLVLVISIYYPKYYNISIAFSTILSIYIIYISIFIALDINISIKKYPKLYVVSSICFSIFIWLSGSFFYETNNNLIFSITGYSADNFPFASNILLCNDILMALTSTLWIIIYYIVISYTYPKFFCKKNKFKYFFTTISIIIITFQIFIFIANDFFSTQYEYSSFTKKVLLTTFILPEEYLNKLPNRRHRNKGYTLIKYDFKYGEKLHLLNNGNVLVYKPPDKIHDYGSFHTIKINHLPYKVWYDRP